MRIVRPYAIQDGDLTTNATESVAAWSSVTAYTTGQTVSYARKVWEAIQNGTNKQPDINPLFWFELRPSNPWAMFDNKTGTQTVRADDLTVTVDVDGYADMVGLLNISASTLNVKVRAPTPERTNILLWSEDFSNAAWQKVAGGTGIVPVVTLNDGLAPDGTMTAAKVHFDLAAGTSGDDYSMMLQDLDDLVFDGDYTGSCWIKAASPSDVGKTILFRHVGAYGLDVITLTSEYQRIFSGEIAVATSGSMQFLVAGGITSQSVSAHICWPQLETGTEPTEYIPTTSAPASSSTTQVFNEDIPLVDETAVTDYYEYFFEPIIRLTDVVVPLPPDIFSPSITVKLEDAGEDVKAGHMIVGKSRYIGEAEYGATIGITDYSRIEEDDFGNTYIAERGYNRRGRFNVWITSAMVDAVYNIVSSYRATPIMIIATEKYNSTLYFGLLREAEIEIAYPNYSIMSVEVRGL